MFDGLVKFGMNFDWISPLMAIATDIINGGSRTFLIPITCGWTGREIEKLLKSRGIKTWGLMMINDTFTISVPKEQGKWAERVLILAGLLV